jgi:hypothetical protein
MIIFRRKYSTVAVRYPLGTPAPPPFIVNTQKYTSVRCFYALDVKWPENQVGLLSHKTSCIQQTPPKLTEGQQQDVAYAPQDVPALSQSPTRYTNGECDSKPGHNQKMPPSQRYGSFYFAFLPTTVYFREVSGKHRNPSVYGGNRFFESLGENSKADNPIPININDENYNSNQGNLTTVVCATCCR